MLAGREKGKLAAKLQRACSTAFLCFSGLFFTFSVAILFYSDFPISLNDFHGVAAMGCLQGILFLLSCNPLKWRPID